MSTDACQLPCRARCGLAAVRLSSSSSFEVQTCQADDSVPATPDISCSLVHVNTRAGSLPEQPGTAAPAVPQCVEGTRCEQPTAILSAALSSRCAKAPGNDLSFRLANRKLVQLAPLQLSSTSQVAHQMLPGSMVMPASVQLIPMQLPPAGRGCRPGLVAPYILSCITLMPACGRSPSLH